MELLQEHCSKNENIKDMDLVWLYFYSIIELNLAKMKKELGLKNTINVVVDFQNVDFINEIVQFLVEINNNSFPTYLKHLYLLNIDIPKLMEDTETREILKSREYKHKVLVLPEDYYTALFKQI
jgi:hypothetical protein